MSSVRDTVAGMIGGTVDFEDGLDRLTVAPAAEVDPALTAAIRTAVANLADRGWQPLELHRAVARGGEPLRARLVVYALGALLDRSPVDPRWQEQADELEARSWPIASYLAEAAARWRVDRVRQLDAAVGLLDTLRRLPPIEILVPPPGTAATTVLHHPDRRLLGRVRALLAKAEATEFEAEAETYTAKAQELIARHSIEEITAPTAETVPHARRIGVDHPYEGEKASLLHAVARANRCHTVWSPELGFATVFGFDADIDAVEVLYTSLLVQGHRAMTRAEPRGGKARIKAFRRSFLIAYAYRIGERLEQAATATVTREAADLLPVLASRDAQARGAMERAFPRTERVRGARIDSDEGWESGRAAADQAALS